MGPGQEPSSVSTGCANAHGAASSNIKIAKSIAGDCIR